MLPYENLWRYGDLWRCDAGHGGSPSSLPRPRESTRDAIVQDAGLPLSRACWLAGGGGNDGFRAFVLRILTTYGVNTTFTVTVFSGDPSWRFGLNTSTDPGCSEPGDLKPTWASKVPHPGAPTEAWTGVCTSTTPFLSFTTTNTFPSNTLALPVTLTGERILCPSVGAVISMFGCGCPAVGVVGRVGLGAGGEGVWAAVGDVRGVVGFVGVAVSPARGLVAVGAGGNTGVRMARVGDGAGVDVPGAVGVRKGKATAVGAGTVVRVGRGVATGRPLEGLIPGSPTPPIARPMPTPTNSVNMIMPKETACRTTVSTYSLSLVVPA